MKLVTYRLADFEGSETDASFGAVRGNEVVRLDVAPGHDTAELGSAKDYIHGLPRTADRARRIVGDRSRHGDRISGIHRSPALPDPEAVLICETTEDGMETRTLPHATIAGPNAAIPLLAGRHTQYSLRPQLGMVTSNNPPTEGTMAAQPAAYVIFTEIIAHEIESGERSTVIGLGPYLVTPDDVPDPLALDVVVSFPDREPWHGSTATYTRSPGELLLELHRRYNFRAGTLIGLGPIPGSFGLDGAEWLPAGLWFTVEITGLGELRQHLGPR